MITYIKNIRLDRIIAIFIIAATIIWLLPEEAVYAKSPFQVNVKWQGYELLKHDGNPTLAVSIKAGIYKKNATMKTFITETANFSEDNKLKYPEYVIIKQFKLIQNGKRSSLFELYHGKKSKEFAHMLFRNWGAKRKRIHKMRGIRFHMISKYGPLVVLKWEYIPKNSNTFTFVLTSYLRKFNDRYYLVKGYNSTVGHMVGPLQPIPPHTSFSSAVSLFPWWKSAGKRSFKPDDSMNTLKLYYNGNSKKYSNSYLKVWINLQKFPRHATLFGKTMKSGRDHKVVSFMRHVVTTYRKNNVDGQSILQLWDPRYKKIVKDNVTSSKYTLTKLVKPYKKIKNYHLEFLVSGVKYYWLYVRPVYKHDLGNLDVIQMFKNNNNLYLTKWFLPHRPTKPPKAKTANGVLTGNDFLKKLRAKLINNKSK